MAKSEFGSGVVVCLVKFSEHLAGGSHSFGERMIRTLDSWRELSEDQQTKEKQQARDKPLGDAADLMRTLDIAMMGRRTPSEAISYTMELWMNAASDHFYDLDRERAPQPLIELADLTLKIGHGFTGQTWTIADLDRIRELWQASSEALDKALGATPDWGEW